MNFMKISQKGIDLIKKFEGCKLYAYRDSVGVPTIGYGHIKNVKMGMSITQQQAEQFLKEDIVPIEKELNGLCINFSQNHFDALCSFVFNLGVGNFNSSTLKKYIVANRSDIEIAGQIVRWVNAGGKPLLGLKKRRVEEANMFVGSVIYYVDNIGNIVKK